MEEEIVQQIHPFNRIWIETNSRFFCGGESITGYVELVCKVAFSAKKVLVRFEGRELGFFLKTSYVTKREWSSDTGRFEVVREKIVSKVDITKELVRETFLVHTPVNSEILPGHFSFPFAIDLPNNLPASSILPGANEYNVQILYELKAYVETDEVNNFNNTIPITIFQPQESSQLEMGNSNKRSVKSIFATPGEIFIKAVPDRYELTPGETCIIKVSVNNTSLKYIREMSLTLKHIIFLKNEKGNESQSIDSIITTNKYPGFPIHFYGNNYVSIGLPVGLPSSTKGICVQSRFVVELKFEIPFEDDMMVRFMLLINPPPFLYRPLPHQPPKIEPPQNESFRPLWESDEAVANCTNCKAPFSILKTQHHCRYCGKIYCDRCTSKRVSIPKLGYIEPVRVCEACFKKDEQAKKVAEAS